MLQPLRDPYASPVDYAELAQAVPALAPLSVALLLLLLPTPTRVLTLTPRLRTACDPLEMAARRSISATTPQ